MTITLQALTLVENAELVQDSCNTYASRTDGICEYKMDVKSTWIPTLHQMGIISWLL